MENKQQIKPMWILNTRTMSCILDILVVCVIKPSLCDVYLNRDFTGICENLNVMENSIEIEKLL